MKVFSQVFFKKLARVWAAPIITAFSFCQAFFFAPLVSKKKRDYGLLLFLEGDILFYGDKIHLIYDFISLIIDFKIKICYNNMVKYLKWKKTRRWKCQI
jgi:hypothetical protein